jgi:HD-like signal output (HDOD) protein
MYSYKHDKESLIIMSAFSQYGYTVRGFKLDHNNYLRCLQLKPDVILVEMPYECDKQIRFIKLLRSHHVIRNLKVLGYGPIDISKKSDHFDEKLFTKYFPRPLKFSDILTSMKTLLPEKMEEIEESENALSEETDLNAIRDQNILPSMKLGMILQHASSFLAFPFSVPRVLSITTDPKTGAMELARIIETDPVVSPYILKTSNTVFFARRDKRITSMKDAIVRIGFLETRKIVLCIGVMKIFEDKTRNFEFDRKKFWLHSLAVAVTTEFFFSRSDYKGLAEYAFLSGLLHDFGTIVLDEFLPEIFVDVIEKTNESSGEFSSICNSTIGLSPQTIAIEFFKKWNLHELIGEGCKFKNVDMSTISLDTDVEYLQASLYLAHTVVKSLSIGHSCDQFIQAIPSDLLKKMKLNIGITDGMIDNIYNKISGLCQFLKITSLNLYHPYETKIISEDPPELTFISVSNELYSPHFMYLKTLGYPLKKVWQIEEFNKSVEKTDLLIISLDDTTQEDALNFVKSETFKANTAANCIILTEHFGVIQEYLVSSSITVLQKSIDARIFGRTIAELFVSNMDYEFAEPEVVPPAEEE